MQTVDGLAFAGRRHDGVALSADPEGPFTCGYAIDRGEAGLDLLMFAGEPIGHFHRRSAGGRPLVQAVCDALNREFKAGRLKIDAGD